MPLLLSASHPSFLSLLLLRCRQLDPAASASAPSQVPYPCPQELSASAGNLPLSSVCRWAGVCARASCWSVRLSPPRAAAESGQGGPVSPSRSLGHSKPSRQGTAGAGCLSPGSLVAGWLQLRAPRGRAGARGREAGTPGSPGGCCRWRQQGDGVSQPGWGGQGLTAGREGAEPGRRAGERCRSGGSALVPRVSLCRPSLGTHQSILDMRRSGAASSPGCCALSPSLRWVLALATRPRGHLPSSVHVQHRAGPAALQLSQLRLRQRQRGRGLRGGCTSPHASARFPPPLAVLTAGQSVTLLALTPRLLASIGTSGRCPGSPLWPRPCCSSGLASGLALLAGSGDVPHVPAVPARPYLPPWDCATAVLCPVSLRHGPAACPVSLPRVPAACPASPQHAT